MLFLEELEIIFVLYITRFANIVNYMPGLFHSNIMLHQWEVM
jgi:hypothetical protein